MRDNSLNRSRFFLALAVCTGVAVGVASRAQNTLSEADLVGVWQGAEITGDLVISGEVMFFPDGHYQRSHVLGQLMTMTSGPYRVAENWVHFAVDDYEPKWYAGVAQYPPPSETWVLEQFDGVQLSGSVGITRIDYHRVQ
ncbi:hypothetical protein [Rhodobacter ferrooxidans]|uniref:Lipocalin-like domain-containing protein n=1 Tax=Rhodobacter ferrooxidans TaxID=371731 RepID=C8RYV7_9RHOB|nr:hypothetical protein [Rhodobacter sp. SW2]EEW25914.1 hypothetical protein Rsw2DRAFT_0985 [Rhodobacter sp. SW2]